MDESCVKEIYPCKCQKEYYVKVGMNFPQKKIIKLILCNARKKDSDEEKIPPLPGKPMEPQLRCVGPEEAGAKDTLFSFSVSEDFYTLITTGICTIRLYIEDWSENEPKKGFTWEFVLCKGRYRLRQSDVARNG